MTRTRAIVAAALAAPALLVPAVAAASTPSPDTAAAATRTEVFRAQLAELNDSGATGTARLLLRGTELTVHIQARGLLPNAVHAQHIHGKGSSECPPPSAAGNDGVLDVLDGAPFYGPVAVSLTTSGDTSPAAGLRIEIMPVSDERGRIDYRRTVPVPADVAADLQDFQVVQHGVDLNGSGAYDVEAGLSELDPGFPLEATVPANCGLIDHVGSGHQH